MKRDLAGLLAQRLRISEDAGGCWYTGVSAKWITPERYRQRVWVEQPPTTRLGGRPQSPFGGPLDDRAIGD